MKLFAILSIGFALVAAAVSTPASGSSVESSSVMKTQSFVVPRQETAGDDVPYFVFNLTVAQYCNDKKETHMNATFKAYSFEAEVLLGDDYLVYFELGRGLNLELWGSDKDSRIDLRYDYCHWNINESKECAWCIENHDWSSKTPLDCSKAGAGRDLDASCAINMNAHSPDKRDMEHEDIPSATTDGHGLEAISTILTAAQAVVTAKPKDPKLARDILVPVVALDAAAATTSTLIPTVIQTSTPGEAPIYILPFHYHITEYCEDGAKKVEASYINGNFQVANMDLPPNETHDIDHLIPGFPLLTVGPFNYDTSTVEFGYSNGEVNCDWLDFETWKQCGECRAGLWSGPPLDCAVGGERIKDMDCSFILGKVGRDLNGTPDAA